MEIEGLFPSGVLQRLLRDVELMPMMAVAQEIPAPRIMPQDLSRALDQALCPVLPLLRPGMRIGITAGSRGIDQIAPLLARLAAIVRERGAEPFIVPCMGSHGNTAKGQLDILAGLGITPATVGAPLVSRDELVIVGTASDGRPVYMDRFLWETDGVIVVNRIKAHTAFHGPIESGLLKMMAVGMGKQKGAAACHRDGFSGILEKIMATSQVVLASGKICFGLAVLENAYGQLCRLEAMPGEEISRREPLLLKEAKELMPSIPFDAIDLLIVDEIGKDISGSGMDTNVIGRYPTPGMTGGPMVEQLVALALTPASEGSGHGMGFADFVSARLLRALNLEKTYPNGLTNRTSSPAKIPPVMPNDRCAIQAALCCLSPRDTLSIRAVRIKNTHQLGEFFISPALWEHSRCRLTRMDEPRLLNFDGEGNLL